MNESHIRIALEARGLRKDFGSQAVLDSVDLRIAEGESVAVIGANGAGKTTLLRCLGGLASPSAGEVYWHGQRAAARPALRSLVGLVAHEGLIYPHLTAGENLLFAARMWGIAKPEQRMRALMSVLGLEGHTSVATRKLSRGMRQRLSIARALVHEPAILILDEPFAALDAAGAEWLKGLMGELQRRMRTICFTTHDIAIARDCADRVLMLCAGGLREFDGNEAGERTALPIAKAA